MVYEYDAQSLCITNRLSQQREYTDCINPMLLVSITAIDQFKPVLSVCNSQVVHCYSAHVQHCAVKHTVTCRAVGSAQSFYTFSRDITQCCKCCHRTFPIHKIIKQMVYFYKLEWQRHQLKFNLLTLCGKMDNIETTMLKYHPEIVFGDLTCPKCPLKALQIT